MCACAHVRNPFICPQAHATGAAQKNWGSSGGWDDAYTLEYLSSPRGHNPLRVYYQRAGGDEAFHTIHLDGATGSDISVESIKEQMTVSLSQLLI